MVVGKVEPRVDWESYWQENEEQIYKGLRREEPEYVRSSSYVLIKAIKAEAVEKLDPAIGHSLREKCVQSDDDVVLTNAIGSVAWVLATNDDGVAANILRDDFLNRVTNVAPKDLPRKRRINSTIAIAVASLRNPELVGENRSCIRFLRSTLNLGGTESTYAGLAFANIAHNNSVQISDYHVKFCNTLIQSDEIGNDRLFAAMAYCLRNTIPQVEDSRTELGNVQSLVPRLIEFTIESSNENHQALALQALAPIFDKWGSSINDELIDRIRELPDYSETENAMMALAWTQVLNTLSRSDIDVDVRPEKLEKMDNESIGDKLNEVIPWGKAVEEVDGIGKLDEDKCKLIVNLDITDITNTIKGSPNSKMLIDLVADSVCK